MSRRNRLGWVGREQLPDVSCLVYTHPRPPGSPAAGADQTWGTGSEVCLVGNFVFVDVKKGLSLVSPFSLTRSRAHDGVRKTYPCLISMPVSVSVVVRVSAMSWAHRLLGSHLFSFPLPSIVSSKFSVNEEELIILHCGYAFLHQREREREREGENKKYLAQKNISEGDTIRFFKLRKQPSAEYVTLKMTDASPPNV